MWATASRTTVTSSRRMCVPHRVEHALLGDLAAPYEAPHALLLQQVLQGVCKKIEWRALTTNIDDSSGRTGSTRSACGPFIAASTSSS
jgi:hypothetical protein